jgi:hypothetical protein
MRDIGMDMALDILSPFVSPSMVTEAIVKSSNNQPLTPTEQVIEKVIKQVGGALTPGTVRFILKRMEYEQQKDVAQDPDGEIVPNRYGYSMPKGEVDLLAFLGIKRGRQDFTESYRNNMRPILQAYERADAPFIKTVTDRRGASSEDVIKSYEESQNIRRRQAQRVKAMADAYYDLGMDMNEVSRAMTKDGILGDKSGDLDKIFNIMDNIFIPSNIPPLAQLQTIPGGSGTQLPYNELLAIINKYSTMGVE